MNGKSKTVKLSVMLILMIALMFSTAFMMIIKATEDTEKTEVKDAKYKGEYTIEYLIKHFNLITFGDVSQAEHIVGPVLIGGNINSNLNHSQHTGGISSYVKGKIKGGNVSNDETPRPTLYLGKNSGAKILEYGSVNVNDTWYTNNPTVITDDYLNFDTLFSTVRTQSQNLSTIGEKAKIDDDGKVQIKIGDRIIIDNLEKVKVINIEGNRQSTQLTLINIKDSGNIKMPDVHINGQQTSTGETDATGNSIVWNIPNATQVQMAESPSIGHIVAPKADVKTGNSNYAGCMIAKSLDGHIEGHYWLYNGISLPLKEIPKEEPKDKNNTTQNNTTKPSNNTTGNNTTTSKNNTTKPSNNTTVNNTTASKNNTTKPKNNTTGNSTTASKNNTTKPKNNTTGNSATASKNNTTKPKNNTTGNSTTASKNNTTKNNVAVANKTNKTNTSKNEDGMVLGAEWEKNNTSKNKTDKTTADGKLPQTGDEFNQKIVLAIVLIALVVVFGAKYIKHKNKLDANK